MRCGCRGPLTLLFDEWTVNIAAKVCAIRYAGVVSLVVVLKIGKAHVYTLIVTFYHESLSVKRCIFHSSAVTGADGFGFAPKEGAGKKLNQLGSRCH